MPQPTRNLAIWMAAYVASCASAKRKLVDVRIVDENGNQIRRQSVSTKRECQGDQIAPPGETWYVC